MDDIDNAINIGNSDSSQQPDTATTMITMTNAAPVVQQIVEDYEPDPKWEMTTLEKASFDCGDLLMDNNSNDEQPPQNHDMEEPKTEADKRVESTHSDSVVLEKVQLDSEQPTQNITLESVKPVLPDNNDCFVSLHSMVNANVQSNLNVQQMDQLEEEKNYPVENNVAPPANDNAPDCRANERASSSVMSQSSVDAHMESVIEHAVELGGGQQISQTLGHQPEDEKKAVEHIQREILGCRNPMESLAELASQQPIMTETTPGTRQADNGAETSEKDASDTTTLTFNEHIKPEQADESQSKSETANQILIEPVAAKEDVVESRALTKNECKPSADSPSKEVNKTATLDCPADTAAPQPLEQPKKSSSYGEPNTGLNVESVEMKETEEAARDVPNEPVAIIEETVELIEETVGDVEASDMVAQPSPIVQEASSADEADDEKKSSTSDASGGEVIVMQTDEDKKEELSPQASDENQSGIGKSDTDGIKATASHDDQGETKVEDKEEQPAEVDEPPTRRSSRRASSRHPIKESSSIETANNNSKPVGVRGKRGRKASGPEKDESKQDESLTENFADIVERAEAQLQEDDNVKTNDDDKMQETNDETQEDEDITDETAKDEPQGTEKSLRTLRTRAAKRPIEEVDDADQEEPSSKPVKRSRASVGQQQQQQQRNKSFVSLKSTPIVKLPQKSSRATISNSDPATRPRPATSLNSSNYEFSYHDGGANRKYKCNNCKYSTDRLNNIVFHHKRSTEFISGVRCPGILRDAEEQRAEIIRLQQTPKGNKRKNYNRYS